MPLLSKLPPHMDLHLYENGVKALSPSIFTCQGFTINHSQVPTNMSDSDGFNSAPHVALLPSAGMGHLTPFLRLAASLVQHQSHVVLITTHPTVSLAESQAISTFLSAFPQVVQKPLNLLPLDSANPTDDPFFLQWEAIRRSAHLLLPLLSSTSPHLSALISDVTLFSSTISITSTLGLRNYVLFTSSARMFSLLDSYPNFVASNIGSSSVQFESSLEIPGLAPIPKSSIPPALLNTNSLFAKNFLENAQSMIKSNGVLINTFESLESDTLSNLNRKRVEEGGPPLYALGPFLPWELEKRNHGTPLKWLDDQPEGSVVYVSFGSRTALSREQMKELGNGLEKSGERFLWVVKDKKVDKEDEESLDNLLDDDGFIDRIKNQGLLIKGWVDQEAVLSHRAVSGFITHGGWNSLVEAAWHGVPLFVWPQGGDQKVNAEAVERSGLGIWRKSWGWSGEAVVKGEEITESIKEMVVNNSLRNQAAKIREEARKAVGFNGSSEMTINGLVEEWKKKEG